MAEDEQHAAMSTRADKETGASRPLRVLVAIKQVPSNEELELDSNNRLTRTGVSLEMSAYCRRALATGIELARSTGGRCVVVSLGPPSAQQVLREALACGADEAFLLSDPVFAGSDTLATARALAAFTSSLGPLDFVLVGRASLDAETGQVGPQLAELLDLPFAAAVLGYDFDSAMERVRLRCEHDDGGAELEVKLPAVLALAERSCRPAKATSDEIEAIGAERVVIYRSGDLGEDRSWGEAASRTRVEEGRAERATRTPRLVRGELVEQVRFVAGVLRARGSFGNKEPSKVARRVVSPRHAPAGASVAVVLEPDRPRLWRELLGAAADLGHELGAEVVALGAPYDDLEHLWSLGVDHYVELGACLVEQDVAHGVATWASDHRPQVLLASATSWGREVAARVGARLDVGVVAEALELFIVDGRLHCTKSGCAGQVVVSVTCTSPLQIATVRPGVLDLYEARSGICCISKSAFDQILSEQVKVLSRRRDDDVELLERAQVVLGVGLGVVPEDYGELEVLAARLGGELAATRKVTDRGLLPRARQVGITGRNLAPRLYVAIGISGSHNHLAGVRRAETILAINRDPAAPIFSHCDVGIVGDWREAGRLLVDELEASGLFEADLGDRVALDGQAVLSQ